MADVMQSRAHDLAAGYGPVFVGLRGSGKSRLVDLVASELSMEAIDADAELEKREGRSIADIFAHEGEAHFRMLEQRLLVEDLLLRQNVVLATGGGAVLHEAVRDLMQKRQTIWLHAPLAVLAQRIAGTDRPSLTGDPIEQELRVVFERREALYKEAAWLVVDTSAATAPECAQTIVSQLGNTISGR